jgi:cytochrome c-550 PedF
MMKQDKFNRPARALAVVVGSLMAATVWAHGDVTPQAVDISSLPKLGEQWKTENPYSKNEAAIKIGASGYNQNCARCHGLDGISGGIAPDLRLIDKDCAAVKDAKKQAACKGEIDDFFANTVRKGRTRNGAVYMPPFEGILQQEAVWSIKAWLETRRERPF